MWRKQLDNRTIGLNSLSVPTILGPIITHRGIKELIFIAGSSGSLYAVDADLGRTFWTRRIEATAPIGATLKPPCGAGLTATPVISPEPSTPGAPPPAEQDDDEGHTPLRPIFVLAADGMLHRISPSTGLDMSPAHKFLPPDSNASGLALEGNAVSTVTTHACAGVRDGEWSIEVNTRNPAPAKFTPLPPLAGPIFEWKGRQHVVGVTGDGHLALAAADDSRRAEISRAPGAGFTGSPATWEDRSGVRWIYAVTGSRVAAFRLSGEIDRPALEPVWSTGAMSAPAAPAIANGVIFVLETGESAGIRESTHATLFAYDAANGRQLFSSGNSIASFVHSSGLAIANGHICFGTFDNTLYCFGFPIEI